MGKVSIVLPTYNGEQYLEAAIESVLAQTYQNWELIIVNDCSADGTANIAKRYERQDPRIRVIHNEENQKLPCSLNIGFRCASGNYLTWTSDDNCYKPGAIEAMVQVLENLPEYGLVYSKVDYILEDEVAATYQISGPSQLYTENVVGACFLYKREILETVGEYDPDMILVEDYDYWLRISKKYKIFYIQESLYQYRYHGKSLTATKYSEIKQQQHRLRMRELEYLIKKTDIHERAILFLDMWVYGSKEIWRYRGQFFQNGILPEEIKWFENIVNTDNNADSDRELILFGAGAYGHKALKRFGKKRVRYFADNDPALVGTEINGVPVISFSQLTKIYQDYHILLSVRIRTAIILAQQLEMSKIRNYTLYVD